MFIPLTSHAKQHWQCFAFDNKHQSFTANSRGLKRTMRLAKRKCRKQSRRPKTCQTAQSYCQANKIASERECLVTDKSGKTFTSKHCKQALVSCRLWQFKHGAPNSSNCNINHRKL